MPGDRFSLSDYRDVAERIKLFYDKYPEGRLTSEIINFEVEGRGKVGTSNTEVLIGWCMVKGYAYRTPDDPHPGTGHSYLIMPGNTPYTRGSEIENAETSAWGRAIVAVGIETKKIASADEINSKQMEDYEGYTEVRITPSNREQPARGGHQRGITRPQVIEILGLSRELNYSPEELVLSICGLADLPVPQPEGEVISPDEAKRFVATLTADTAGEVIQHLREANQASLLEQADAIPMSEAIELKFGEQLGHDEPEMPKITP
jgi:hypothetical protein